MVDWNKFFRANEAENTGVALAKASISNEIGSKKISKMLNDNCVLVLK